ncbi:MAG: arsenate reductase [Saprospiraceae bacterium]|nr:arsenate reductase [Saprospiraceae bacterium]
MKKNKIYHLTHCGTCKKILNELNTESCELSDIKLNKISEKELDQLAKLAGSYEALFSRKAVKYQSLGLKDRSLTELDYKQLILSDYTFIKRPIIKVGTMLFIGHTKQAIEGGKQKLGTKN